MVKKILKNNKGFTLVELMISISIFAFMTAFFVAKYGTFNQNILLTSLAYDVALTIRNAQSYGLNVKSKPIVDGGGQITTNYSSDFTSAYGVNFNMSANTKVIFYVDADGNGNGKYDVGELISTQTIQRGSTIYALCAGTGPSTGNCTSVNTLDVTYKRPDPNAIIIGNSGPTSPYAEITLRATDGNMRKIAVRATGQIQICNNNNVCR
jgi:prepilin-type N-terminal cleavage/methylation domain-containing protein